MWKYSLILQHRCPFEEEDFCEVVEIYQTSPQEESEDFDTYTSYGSSDLMSLEELERAYLDVKKDGVNTYFYDTIGFYWDGDAQGFSLLSDSEPEKLRNTCPRCAKELYP